MVAAVIGGVGVGLRRIYKAAKWLEEVHTLTHELSKEFKPNGGTSMRDQMNRVEGRVQWLEDWCARRQHQIDGT